MGDKFLGIGRSITSLEDGTANLNINALTMSGLDTSQPVKTNSIRQLISSKLSISDVNGLQNALNNTISNPLTTDLNLNSNNITNVGTISNTSSSVEIDVANDSIDNLTVINPSADTLTIGGNLSMNNSNITNTNSISVSSINGTSSVGLEVRSDIAPEADGLHELGKSNKYWTNVFSEDVYCDRITAQTGANGITINSKLIPLTAVDLGSSTSPFGDVFSTTMRADSITLLDIYPLTATQVIGINGNLIPRTDNAWNIGDVSNKFSNLYSQKVNTNEIQSILGDIQINTNLVPSTGTIDLGSSSTPFGNVYSTTTRTNNLQAQTGSTITQISDIEPNGVGTRDLGTSTNYYGDVYTNTTNTNNLQAITGGITSNNSIAPNTNNTKDLGSNANRWRDIYSTRIRTDAIDGLTTTNVTLQGNIIPDNNASRTLGNSTSVFSQVNTRTVYSDNTTIMMRLSNDDAYRYQFNRNYLRPLGAGVVSLADLGLSASRWRNIYLVNQPNVSSSRVKKKNITNCEMGLNFLNRLQPVMYHHITTDDSEKKQCGLIYEDVEQVVNEMGISFGGLQKDEYDDVDPDTGETTHVIDYGIKYGEFIPILINCVKELKAEIELLKSQINISP